MSKVDAALAILLAQNAYEQESLVAPTVKVTVSMSPKPSKPIKAKRVSEGPIQKTPGPCSVPLPETGSLDAQGFLIALRSAGKRISPSGMPFTDPTLVRNDTIVAIAAFIGYNPRESFGSQETAARMMASRLLNKRPNHGPTRQEHQAALRQQPGYVAGVADHTSKLRANLLAREIVAAEARDQHVRDARDPSRSMADRQLSVNLARIESERLESIRADLARLP